MSCLLREVLLGHLIKEVTGVEFSQGPHAIGELRNRRSRHVSTHGLHRIDLTWDELEFPTGPSQMRFEVEAHTKPAERLLGQVTAAAA